ncbi:MAG: hypothetical protein AMXMBFR64_00310 [Myxococcales bacterium]
MEEPTAAPNTVAGRPVQRVPFPLVVDFGTSSTLACTARGAHDMGPRTFPEDGPEPSLLLFESVADPAAPRFTVGQNARARAFAYPRATVPSVKKLLGRPEPCHVVAIDGTEADFSPDDIARMFLSSFLEDAIIHLGWWPDGVVCTWPRSFSPSQLTRLRTLVEEVMTTLAARNGIDQVPAVEAPFDEANASALYCLTAMLDEVAAGGGATLQALDGRSIVAFDVGGGTTDSMRLSVAVLEGALQTLPSIHTRVDALGGDFAFGGDMITSAVVRVLEEALRRNLEAVASVPTAAEDGDGWRANFFALFRVAESIKARLSAGARLVLIRDVLSELPGPIRVIMKGEEPREESFDAARLSAAVADVAVARDDVDALVRPAIERNVEGLARLCAERRADVLVLAGNGVQYPLYLELIEARRADLIEPKGRIVSSQGGGKQLVATGAWRALVNNLDAFRLADLRAATATAVSNGDYYFLTTTGRIAHIPGLRQPFIRAGEAIDPDRGLTYDTGQEDPPVRIPLGAFVVGRRQRGQAETEPPQPIQMFYPAGPVPPKVNGARPRPTPAPSERDTQWAEVKDTIRVTWSDFNEAIGALSHTQKAVDAPIVRSLVDWWSDPPDLSHDAEPALLAACHTWLRRMMDAWTTIGRLKETRRFRYRKVRLRPGLAETLRRCVDQVDRLATTATAQAPPREAAPVNGASHGAVFCEVRLGADLSIQARYLGDGFTIEALTTGAPARFYEAASVFDVGTAPFGRG